MSKSINQIEVKSVTQQYSNQVRIDREGRVTGMFISDWMDVSVEMRVPIGTDVMALFERPAIRQAMASELSRTRKVLLE